MSAQRVEQLFGLDQVRGVKALDGRQQVVRLLPLALLRPEPGEGCRTPAARNRFLHDLYLQQLRNAAAVR